jgi:hypothetical protein
VPSKGLRLMGWAHTPGDLHHQIDLCFIRGTSPSHHEIRIVEFLSLRSRLSTPNASSYNLLGLPGMPDVHVVCNGVVISSRQHEAIVLVGLEMMCLEPHVHIHTIELGWKATISGIDVVAAENAYTCGYSIDSYPPGMCWLITGKTHHSEKMHSCRENSDTLKRQDMEHLGKMLVSLGALLIVIGLMFWLVADKLSWFGRLPGDLRIERPGFQFYAPLMTSLLLSIGLTLAFWLFNKFFR